MNVNTSIVYHDFFPLIDEYDKIIKSMEQQIITYKDKYESFGKDLKKLVNENKILSKKLQDEMELKNNLMKNENGRDSNDIMDNLKTQINIISEEKDTVYGLWQNSLQIIDCLEAELYIYKSNKEEFIKKIELEKEKEKHALQMKELRKNIKTSLNQQEQKNKSILKNLELTGNELETALKNQKLVLNEIQEKNTEIIGLKEEINKLQERNNNLHKQLNEKEENIKRLCLIDQDTKAKVFESIILIEAVMAEKEVVIKKEEEARHEIKEINYTLSKFIKESNEKLEKEKEKFEENLQKILNDLTNIQKQLNEKNLQVEKQIMENKMLEEEISKLKKGNVINNDNNFSKMLLLEKNLETTFQKLLISERKLMQTTTEKEKLHMDIDQLTESFERNKRTNNLEKLNLQRKIKTIQTELSISNGYIEEYVAQIKELNLKVVNLEEEMTEKLFMKEKTFQKIMMNKINRIKSKNIAVQNEMEYHLNSEHDLNKKWKKESKEIVDKLQKKIAELKRENNNLRVKVRD